MALANPKTTINIVGDVTQIQQSPHRVLFIGQKTPDGTATSGELIQNLGNANQQDSLFGENSVLATMVRDAKFYNKETPFDAIALDDDGGATAASSDVVFAGPATADGEITFSIGSINRSYTIPVTSGDSGDIVAVALEAAVNGDSKSLVTAIEALGTVTLTAVNAGPVGNDLSIKVIGSVPGIGVTLNAFSGGATNPDLTNVFNAVGQLREQTIVLQTGLPLDELKAFLDDRFNTPEQILDGVGIQCAQGTHAAMVTRSDDENSQSLSLGAFLTIDHDDYKGNNVFELNSSIASQFAAVRALRLTDGTNITQYVINSFGTLDAVGGPAIASLPYFNTPLSQLPAIEVGNEFSVDQVNELLNAGAWTLRNNVSRTGVVVGQVTTTYKRDSLGVDDLSFKYLNYVDTAVTFRELYQIGFQNAYAQARLGTTEKPGRKIATDGSLIGFAQQTYLNLGGEEFMLVRDDQESVDFFVSNLTNEIDFSAGRVTQSLRTPIITQLREVVVNIQVTLNIE